MSQDCLSGLSSVVKTLQCRRRRAKWVTKNLPHVQKLTKRTRLGILVSSCVRASVYVEWHQLSILLVSRVQRVERGGGGGNHVAFSLHRSISECRCCFDRDVDVDVVYMRNLIVSLQVMLPWSALPGPHAGPDALQDRAVAAQFGTVLLSCDTCPASSSFACNGAPRN